MSIASVFLVLLSASIHVWWNLLTKSSQSPKAFSLLKGTVLMAMAAVAVVSAPLREIPTDVWAYVVASGVTHALYILALTSAYEAGDLSYVYPIARSAPAFVPLAAFLVLGEGVSLRGGIGILIVVLSVYALQMREDAATELHRLWASLKRRDSRWAFATLGTVVTYTIIDKAGMVAFRQIEAIAPALQGPFYFLLESVLCYLLFWSYMLSRPGVEIRPVWRREWAKAVAAALGTMASYSLILYVMRSENVSYIVTLRQASVFLAVLVGWLALKEGYERIRLTASAAMLVGFYLVATAR
jgi:drug/metabolite transporter (DMT)-like permease